MKKILLLGSGELGKEFTIAAQRLGMHVIACDAYPGAPAMQVADEFEVFHMLDGDALEAAVAKHRPDIIVPEIEAIRTEKLYGFEEQGIQVTPSARAVNFTMNRKAIRDLAAKELGLKTAKYFYATTYEELEAAAREIGFPCVVKPLMSSSGKGQSLVKTAEDLPHAWKYGLSGSRGDIKELIIEEFIHFDSEITLLTVTQKDGPTLFCPPIGHVQKGGDYRESFQPAPISPEHLAEAQRMAAAVTEALTGAGIWGVEFFLSHENGVYFSELSPRPHDTGMVTLAGTQNFNAVPSLKAAFEVAKLMEDAEIVRYGESVKEYIYDALTSDGRIRLYGMPKTLSEKIPLFSISVEGAHHGDLAMILDKMGIAVRSGQMCAEPLMDRFGVTGMLRLSLAPYNTMEEAEYFIKSLDKAIKMLG